MPDLGSLISTNDTVTALGVGGGLGVSNSDPFSGSGNVIQFQLPTVVGGGSGFNFNYDFGPNVSSLSQGAYSFLNARFDTDQAFVGSAISGAQNWLSGLVSPIVGASQRQIDQNTQMLPGIYGSLFNAAQAANTANANIASQSIAANQAIASNMPTGGGMCFITTACCEFNGEADDCDTLQTLRKFRDEFMLSNSDTSGLVKQYYRDAPEIVAKLRARHDAQKIFKRLRVCYVEPAATAARNGDAESALKIYTRGTIYAQEKAHE